MTGVLRMAQGRYQPNLVIMVTEPVALPCIVSLHSNSEPLKYSGTDPGFADASMLMVGVTNRQLTKTESSLEGPGHAPW